MGCTSVLKSAQQEAPFCLGCAQGLSSRELQPHCPSSYPQRHLGKQGGFLSRQSSDPKGMRKWYMLFFFSLFFVFFKKFYKSYFVNTTSFWNIYFKFWQEPSSSCQAMVSSHWNEQGPRTMPMIHVLNDRAVQRLRWEWSVPCSQTRTDVCSAQGVRRKMRAWQQRERVCVKAATPVLTWHLHLLSTQGEVKVLLSRYYSRTTKKILK